jgi:hypothetical protein
LLLLPHVWIGREKASRQQELRYGLSRQDEDGRKPHSARPRGAANPGTARILRLGMRMLNAFLDALRQETRNER